nr:hypothetical protein [Tanacetum cinerariifolium]
VNDDSPTGVASAVREGVTPFVVDLTVEMGKQNFLDDTIVLGSFPPLSMSVSTTAGNAPGKSSYAHITSKPSGKKVNVRTLFTLRGNGIDVVVLGKYGLVGSMFSSSTGLFSFHISFMDGLDAMLENGLCEDGLSAIATKLGTPLMLDSCTSYMCMQSWGRSSYARVMVELKADVELKDNIVVAMPKIARQGHYTCNVRVEYEWKPPRNPLVPTGIVESDSEVELVFDETANLRILTNGKDGSDKGYGTNSLLEEWRNSYLDNVDYD